MSILVDETRWREAWDLKVFGYINTTRQFYRRMRERGHGVIVNVIGLAGEKFDAGYIAGTTGNASLMAFTRGIGSTSIDHGVRILGVNPGAVETDRIRTLLTTRAESELGDGSRWQELFSKLPLGRAASVEEVANVVVFLASEARELPERDHRHHRRRSGGARRELLSAGAPHGSYRCRRARACRQGRHGFASRRPNVFGSVLNPCAECSSVEEIERQTGPWPIHRHETPIP